MARVLDGVPWTSGVDDNTVELEARNDAAEAEGGGGGGSMTGAEILAELVTVDGAGSTLDSDLLDNMSSAAFVQMTGDQTIAGTKTFSTAPVIPASAYDATGWNGSQTPATKDAVRDKVEDILDGVTFTGDVVVPDEAYDATAWNGSLEVPTKNAVRDKLESMPTLAPTGAFIAFNTVGTTTTGAVDGSTATDLGAGSPSNLLLPTQAAVKSYVDGKFREAVLGSNYVHAQSNTTLADVTGVGLSVVANAVYRMMLLGYYITAANADLKIGFTGPASSTLIWQEVGLGLGLSSGFESTTIRRHRTLSEVGTFGGQGVTASDDAAFMCVGRLVTGANAGTLQLQAAQNTSQASDTTVLAGTVLYLHRVS